MKIWRRRTLRLGVYVDAFNVYYGARSQCGRGAAGWRWLDLFSLSERIASARFARPTRITTLKYCTALREKDGDASSARDQTMYLNALQVDGRAHIEFGQYNVKMGKGVLVQPTPRRRYKRVVSPGRESIPTWLPAEETMGPEGDVNLLVQYTSFEEKGSDVNVATHLLSDAFRGRVDAAIVISNDGDLRLPLQVVRHHIPIGLINPTQRPLSQMLKGDPSDGVGGHWWHRLQRDDFFAHQLPPSLGGFHKPAGW